MVHVDKHAVLEILRHTISRSTEDAQSILSPVLLDIIMKMSSWDTYIDMVLACIDEVYADAKDDVLPGIDLVASFA
eukprot:4664633-Pleurochrysis_carterae.AAC.1